MSTSQVPSPADDRIDLAAHKLAVYFTEDADLPARYRRLTDLSRKIRKVQEDSQIEKRFRANVESWRRLIDTMLVKIDESQAWRIISLSPRFDGTVDKLIANKDFCDFVDCLILRRD